MSKQADKAQADYVVENHGTIWMFQPMNDQAAKNLKEGVDEAAIWMGTALAVEHRYGGDLVEQLRAEGWRVEG